MKIRQKMINKKNLNIRITILIENINYLEENIIKNYSQHALVMTIKKTTSSLSHSAMPSNFRTLIKNRVSKQTLKDVVHLSAAIQSNFDQDDKLSVKSTASVHKISDSLNYGTDKLKNFVRNMKVSQHANDQPAVTKILKSIDNRDLAGSRKSLSSVRSSKSRVQNFNSFHLDKDISDSRSIVSTRSLRQSQIMLKSKLFSSKQNDEPNREKLLEKLGLLEQRIDYLNKTKLKNLTLKARSTYRFQTKLFNTSGTFTPTIEPIQEESELEKQLYSIISAILVLKQKESEERVNLSQLEQNIVELDKKIELWEKILASNYTEAEILRKYYFAQKSQKCPHLSRKENIIQQLSKQKDMLKTNSSMIEMRDLRRKQPVIRYQSTSKYSYTKPAQAAYDIHNNRMRQFVPNRQPLPRSSYDREFLNYGTLPVFNYKPHDTKHLASHLHTKTSSYQQTFKQRHIDLKQVNYRQLDCFKDKFKMGTISFSEMYKKYSQAKTINKKEPSRKQKDNNNSIQKAMDTLDSLQSTSKSNSQCKFLGSTEMKSEFLWHSKENQGFDETKEQEVKVYGRSSVIKDGKLNKLKASYKMQFLR